nr:hypothetical protein [uncultured Roseateles sp.]
MAATSRFARLNTYLQRDSGNANSLQDAFRAACAESLWDDAQALLQRAQSQGHAPRQWALHEAHLFMARQRWPEAIERLRKLQSATPLNESERLTIATDLAQVHLRLGQISDGVAALEASVMSVPVGVELDSMVEETWLRLLHRGGELDRALQWGRDRETAERLSAAAAGVLSLVALDAALFEDALRWSVVALRSVPEQLEANLTRASLALTGSDPREALHLSERLAVGREHDGRVWSNLATARLLNQDLPGAKQAYLHASSLMPDHIGTWHGLAWTALLQGDLQLAESTFQQALSLDRNFADSHGGLAAVLAAIGRRLEASESVRRAPGLDAKSLAAHYAQLLLDDPNADRPKLLRMVTRLFGRQVSPNGENLVAVMLSRAVIPGPD